MGNIVRSQVVIAILFGDKLNSGSLEFGLTVNPAMTNISNSGAQYKGGLNLGIYFNIWANKRLFLHAEAIAKGSFGAKRIIPYPTGSDTLDYLFSGGSVERKIRAFSLPLLARYGITKKFFVEAGVQTDLILRVEDIFNARINDNPLDYKTKVTDEFTRLDFGVAGGLFYKFKNDKRSMGMGVRYMQGLTDIHKSTAGTQANTSWQLTITIPIGAAGKSDTDKNARISDSARK
jgi:hypothetical protein